MRKPNDLPSASRTPAILAGLLVVVVVCAAPASAVANQFKPTASTCKAQHILQRGWVHVDEDTWVTHLDITQDDCRPKSPPPPSNELGNTTPSAHLSDTISCSVVVHTQQTTSDDGWWLLIWWSHTVTVSATVKSDVSCDGDYLVTITHSGGLGPRTATDAIRHVDLTHSTLDQGDAGACTYVYPLAPSCQSIHTGEATLKQSGIGGIVTSITPCATYDWTDSSQVPLIGGDSGTDQVCGDAIPVSTADLAFV